MEYYECEVLAKLKRSDKPLITKVKTDEFTSTVEKNFDYKFTGESCFYPYVMPNLNFEFKTLCIVGASGSGKSTLIRQLQGYKINNRTFDDNAIVSNFETPEVATEKLSAVGLNSMPVWCRPRKVLSVGEGFRADLALNLDSYTVFDEFTSTIDRNVAKSTCKGIRKYIEEHNLHNIIFVSCHKDFIPYLKPDVVIDLDYEKMYDCEGADLGKTSPCKSMNPQIRICGEYLGNIII